MELFLDELLLFKIKDIFEKYLKIFRLNLQVSHFSRYIKLIYINVRFS